MAERLLAPVPSQAAFVEASLEGVSLTQYATVLAGRADGLQLAAMLDFVGITAVAWARAEAAWEARLLDDLEAEGNLVDGLDARFAEALGRWPRPLPPLDADLRAWLDFQRAWAHERDADAFLARRGMRAADIVRLKTLWNERLRDDPALRGEAVAILSTEPGEPPAPAPVPATLSPRRIP
jgi:hypothetical protein